MQQRRAHRGWEKEEVSPFLSCVRGEDRKLTLTVRAAARPSLLAIDAEGAATDGRRGRQRLEDAGQAADIHACRQAMIYRGPGAATITSTAWKQEPREATHAAVYGCEAPRAHRHTACNRIHHGLSLPWGPLIVTPRISCTHRGCRRKLLDLRTKPPLTR